MVSLHDEQVPAVARSLGLPGIFDVHVHFMPEPILKKVWAYFDAAGPLLGRPWPITYRLSDDERVARLRAMDVKHFSALSYAHKPGIATYMNDWTRDFSAATPEALWSGTFYPEPEAATYVPDLIGQGVQIFKAHLQVGNFAADDPLLDPVWGPLADSLTPVVLHAGSGPAPGAHTGPDGVAVVLQRHPNLSLIIAHLGAPEFEEFFGLAQKYANVRLDTTMAFVDFFDAPFPTHLMPQVLDLQPKILLGTDFPNIPYHYAHQIEVLQQLNLGDDWMRDVLWNNAAGLFHL